MSKLIEQERFTCAIGALQTVVAIPKAVPILHSGPGCGMMIQGFYGSGNYYAGGSASPCTNFGENEVVFGGTERLKGLIENTYKILDTDLQVVLTGCTAGIVGDDVESIVSEFRDAGKPIVWVDTSGFKCSNFVAHSDVVKAIIEQYVSRSEYEHPSRSDKRLVNLFASIPFQDPFWRGNLSEYKRLLEGLGLKVNILFGPFSGGVEEWKTIPEANFNVLVSPWYGEPIVKYLEERYGQPFTSFRYVPIGANETERFLRQVLEFAEDNNADIDVKTADEFIRREVSAYYEELDSLATFLLEFRYGLPNHVHVIHDAGYVIGLCRFLLHETGIVPKEQFIVDGTPEEYRSLLSELLAQTSDKRMIPVTFDPDAGKAQNSIRKLDNSGRGLIVGSGWDKELALEKGFDFISAAHPSPYRLTLTTNYAGFSGGLRVIEDIYNTVLSTYR
ncbi:MAG: hypothetical protein LBV63_03280 [Candidatus Methanoplasma sp.]|nr:hypothetical protein [Candidatus Methanoplasma sp.]